MLRRVLPALALVVVSCTSATEATTTSSDTTSTGVETTTTTSIVQGAATEERLAELGAEPCPESEFTCVTVTVPLDHYGSDSTEIEVVYAVLPAGGEREGVFVTATGGPGTAGTAYADSYTSFLDPAITERFDIVFFDQRGVGMSGGLTCPVAAFEYYRTDPLTGIGFDQDGLTSAARRFAEDCVGELGDPSLLPYLSTTQVAADLDMFRDTMGYESLVIYGESYGTQVAQTYAAQFGDHLDRMVIDGVVDLTLDGHGFLRDQATAFGDTLEATFEACREDTTCLSDFEGQDPGAAYDRLVALLSEGPLSAQYPLPDGSTATRSIGLGDLEVVTAGQVYGETDRVFLLRALATHANRGDLVPLLRLLYGTLGLDPSDESLLPDDTWSDAIYYGVECLEYHFPGSTPEEKAAGFFANAEGFETRRLGSVVLGDLPCAFWPEVVEDPTRPEPLAATGIPTLVLGATADPATPFQHGLNVLEALDDGYSMSQTGGPHVIFGRGNECPDAAATAFIVDAEPPATTECEGSVIDYYPPLFPESISDFGDAVTFLAAVEDEVIYLPEYWYWDGYAATAAGCAYGGTLDMWPTDVGYGFEFGACAFAPDTILTGEAAYDAEQDIFVLDVTVGSDDCSFHYERSGEEILDVTDLCQTHFDPPPG